MNKCIIFGGSKIDDYSYIDIEKGENDAVICADSGYLHAIKLGIDVDFYIGDFDSADAPKSDNVIKLNPIKDETDMFVCIEKGVELGFREFYIYGALGGRFDHSFANIQLLSCAIDQGVRINLIDENNFIFMIKNETITLNNNEKAFFSIFSYSEKCEGLTLKGVKYTVDNAVITQDFPLGVSNEITHNTAEITVKKGKALIVLSSDK